MFSPDGGASGRKLDDEEATKFIVPFVIPSSANGWTVSPTDLLAGRQCDNGDDFAIPTPLPLLGVGHDATG